MRVETAHGPIECKHNGSGGLYIGDRVKGYGWPMRVRIADRGLFDEEITGTVAFVFINSAWISWDKGNGTREGFEYIMRSK